MRRRIRTSWVLSGIVATSLFSTSVYAEAPGDTDGDAQNNPDAPKAAAQPVVVPPVATPDAASDAPVVPAAKPKFGDMSTSGYFRGGFGGSDQRGRMTCFSLAIPGGLFSKYRLGNECEVWGEYHIATVVHAGEDGSVATLHFMPTVFIPTTYIGYSPNGAVNSPAQFTTSTGAVLYFPNLYVDLKGISWLSGGTAWMGTRYYKRESIYISDFFYWNPSGVGAGIEDVQLGQDLRLSYAVFAVDGDPAMSATPTSAPLPLQLDFGIRNDLQLRGLRLWSGSELQFGVQVIVDASNHPDANGASTTHGGWGATFQYVQRLTGAENKVAVQYGKGGGTGFGTLARFYYPDFSVTHGPSESRLRALDVLTIEPNRWLGGQVAFVYQHDDLGNGQKSDWLSGGGRASVATSEHVKLLGELGVDRVKKNNGSEPQFLAKATAAVALTAGRGFMKRPELRAFFTYARWNETARVATVDSGHVYTATELLTGRIFGLQAEASW